MPTDAEWLRRFHEAGVTDDQLRSVFEAMGEVVDFADITGGPPETRYRLTVAKGWTPEGQAVLREWMERDRG